MRDTDLFQWNIHLPPPPQSQEAILAAAEKYIKWIQDICMRKNDIPLEIITNIEEVYEDFVDMVEQFQAYMKSLDLAWWTQKDKEFSNLLLTIHRWIQLYEPRIFQDRNLFTAVHSFQNNDFPQAIIKLAYKLWIQEDIAEGSSLEERVIYELYYNRKRKEA